MVSSSRGSGRRACGPTVRVRCWRACAWRACCDPVGVLACVRVTDAAASRCVALAALERLGGLHAWLASSTQMRLARNRRADTGSVTSRCPSRTGRRRCRASVRHDSSVGSRDCSGRSSRCVALTWSGRLRYPTARIMRAGAVGCRRRHTLSSAAHGASSRTASRRAASPSAMPPSRTARRLHYTVSALRPIRSSERNRSTGRLRRARQHETAAIRWSPRAVRLGSIENPSCLGTAE